MNDDRPPVPPGTRPGAVGDVREEFARASTAPDPAAERAFLLARIDLLARDAKLSEEDRARARSELLGRLRRLDDRH